MKFNFYTNQFQDIDVNPQKIAISGSDGDFTWTEFKHETEKLIQLLKEIQIPEGHPVLIYGHKERFFPVAITACMSLNIPYVPVDKIYPWQRVQKIIDITQSQVLISCCETIPSVTIPVVVSYRFSIIKNSQPDFENRCYINSHDPIRYIMFTSGSTGEPKGVQITREAVLSFIEWIEKDYPFTSDDVFMNQSPFTFDVSLYDMLSALMLGATVLLIDNALAKETPRFFEKLKKYGATVWTSTPSFAYLFLREKWFSIQDLPQMRMFLFAGEDIPPRTVKTLFDKFPGAMIYNAYGPTEATVTTTWVEITYSMIEKYPVLPIGYPKRDSQILISTENASPENPGEIIIVGNHVSIGYFKNEELSNQKFYLEKNYRAFKTGDLGYYQDDMVFFVGRNDDQIKLNGYRIELGEINSVIRALPWFDDAVTVPVKRGNEVKRLICFVILKENLLLPQNDEIFDAIKGKMPSYMHPGEFFPVSTFPVNSNHKVDRKQLLDDYLKLNS